MDLLADAREHGLVLIFALLGHTIHDISVLRHSVKHSVYQLHDVDHVLLDKTTGSDSGSSDPDTRGLERAPGVEGDHILVESDLSPFELLLSHTTGNISEFCSQVNEHEVVISATGDDFISSGDELFRHLLGVGHHLLLVIHELWLHGLIECHGFGGDDMLQRTALYAREYA